MIDPVSRVQPYTPKVGSSTSKNTAQSDAAPFSMDQALAEESAKDEGVYYEHSSPQEKEKPAAEKKEPSPRESDAIIEKPNADAPLGAIDTGNLIKGIGKVITGLFEKLLKIFGNIWESKPITDGVTSDETSELTDDPLHTEDSINFHKNERTSEGDFGIPQDEFDKAIDELGEESEGTASGAVPEDHIKPFEDKAIKDALLSGDDERFERLITRGGERRPAISSTLLTQYDSKGRIIQIDPSDENLILHGKNRTTRR
ncbi:MAG: hypothetical protein K5871_02660 [Lachnospiraceae bacterium]|nr:hypothetical protein [Lachnospiraceae bacterium]